MDFVRYFRLHRNKILALTFSSLGLLAYLGYYAYIWISTKSFFTDPWEFWNFAITFVAYLVIFIGNVNNDNVAYVGILIFVFMLAVDQIIVGIESAFLFIAQLSSGGLALTGLILNFAALALTIALGVIGILLYIKILQYRRNPNRDFTKVRLYGILYASLLFASLAFRLAVMFMSGSSSALLGFLVVLVPLSEVFTAVSIVFTLERLRRI